MKTKRDYNRYCSKETALTTAICKETTARKRTYRGGTNSSLFYIHNPCMSSVFFLLAILFVSSSLVVTNVQSFLQHQQHQPTHNMLSSSHSTLTNRLLRKCVQQKRKNSGLARISIRSSRLFLSSNNGPKNVSYLKAKTMSTSDLLSSGTTMDVTTPLPLFQSSTTIIPKTGHHQKHRHLTTSLNTSSPPKKETHLLHSKASVLSRPSPTDKVTTSSNDSRRNSSKSAQNNLKMKDDFQEMAEQHNHYWEKAFSLDLPEGKCVGMRFLPVPPSDPNSMNPEQIRSNPRHWIRQHLHPKEIEYGLENLVSDATRNTFYLGRLAMRTALHELGDGGKNGDNLPKLSNLDASILKDEHGRPNVPKKFLGSISHKQAIGVALVAFNNCTNTNDIMQDSNENTPRISVGVDIEQTISRRRSIAKRILTENELKDLGKIKGITKEEEVLLRFSLKESVYKAMHTHICQFVGFQEAEIKPLDDGTALVTLNLKSGAHKNFESVRAHWRRIDGDYFLTSSFVTMKNDK